MGIINESKDVVLLCQLLQMNEEGQLTRRYCTKFCYISLSQTANGQLTSFRSVCVTLSTLSGSGAL